MNLIQESMKEIQASKELKQNTLQYLEKQRKNPKHLKTRSIPKLAVAFVCLFFILGVGGYAVYQTPISYISIDVNPSIELSINRFGKVVSASAYNQEGQDILKELPLKHISYMKAIDRLLDHESTNYFLTEDSLLFFTIVSDRSEAILEKLNTNTFLELYQTMTYISDAACMKEAHLHHMSVGKYSVYLELSQYDETITVDDCHAMTIGEIHNRIEGCQGHTGTTHQGHHAGSGHHVK